MAADAASEHGPLSQETLTLGDPLLSQEEDLDLLSQDDPGQVEPRESQDPSYASCSTQVDSCFDSQRQVPDEEDIHMADETDMDKQVDPIEEWGDDNLEENIVQNIRDMLFVMQGWRFEGKYMQEAGQKCDWLLLEASTLLSQYEFMMSDKKKSIDKVELEAQYEKISKEFAEIKTFYMNAQAGEISTPERKCKKPSP